MTFPGTITYDEVPLPEGALLDFELAEHSRVWSYDEPGPPVVARVLVDDQVVFERRLDARREADQRGWQSVSIDLAAHGGQRVSLGFEVEALGLIEPLPEGLPERFERYLVVGFGEPRIGSSR